MISPLFQFNEQLDDIRKEVVARSTHALGRAWGPTPQDSFRLVLNDAALHEVNRLGRKGEGTNKHLEDWQRLARRIGRLNEHDLRREIEKRVLYYTNDHSAVFLMIPFRVVEHNLRKILISSYRIELLLH